MAVRKRRTIKTLTVAAAFAATMLVAACGAGPSTGAKHAGQVVALNQMSVLRSLFNRDMGHARLVLIFSPT
ncbi:MAG TPA: hypothetical protein VEV63_11495 [Streptosporangiaceae bacterium]|nr:hypothetical protein [Streptosporangiaceae bacterium]